MAGTFSRIKTWTAGETLTAADLNAEFDNIITNADPDSIGDESANVAEMQATTDPGESGTESLATDLKGEILRLRNIIAELSGETYWYQTPDNNLLSTDDKSFACNIVNTAQPLFLVKPTSNQENIPNDATVTEVVFGTEVTDQGSDFASNTFTAPVDGNYLLTVFLGLLDIDSDATYYQLRITTSNETFTTSLDPNWSADLTYGQMALSVVAPMDASDTAVVHFLQDGGTTQTDIATNSYFSGALLW